MTILRSCCFWQSLRSGAYASIIYTLIYYGGVCLVEGSYLYFEREYLTGKVEQPTGESFLERESISATTVIFTILLLFCSSCGVISCFLALYGLKSDQRQFLMPWIITMVADIIFEIVHFIYLIALEALSFDPLISILYTIDLFLMCLNVYCFLCVVSQYQEYKAGRGYARSSDDVNSRPVSIHYIPPRPTAHQHINRSNKNTVFCSTCTDVQATKIAVQLPLHEQRPSKMIRKHVQFPEDFKCVEEESLCCDDSNGNGTDVPAIETPPSFIVSF